MPGRKLLTDRELADKRLEQIKQMRIDNAESAKRRFNEALFMLEDLLNNYEVYREEIYRGTSDPRTDYERRKISLKRTKGG